MYHTKMYYFWDQGVNKFLGGSLSPHQTFIITDDYDPKAHDKFEHPGGFHRFIMRYEPDIDGIGPNNTRYVWKTEGEALLAFLDWLAFDYLSAFESFRCRETSFQSQVLNSIISGTTVLVDDGFPYQNLKSITDFEDFYSTENDGIYTSNVVPYFIHEFSEFLRSLLDFTDLVKGKLPYMPSEAQLKALRQNNKLVFLKTTETSAEDIWNAAGLGFEVINRSGVYRRDWSGDMMSAYMFEILPEHLDLARLLVPGNYYNEEDIQKEFEKMREYVCRTC